MADAPMTDEELVAILTQEEETAVGYREGYLAQEQQVALDFYEGRPFGDEEEGRSQFVTRDVAEVVDYMTASVLRPFVSGDRVVEFEGAANARQISAAMQFLFMRRQSGYAVLRAWIMAGLIEKIGIVKTTACYEEKVERGTVTVDADGLLQLQEAGVGLLEASDNGDGSFLVRTEQRRKVHVFRDENVPSEEFLFSSRAKDEDSADYIAHVSLKTRSELKLLGFDPETVDNLPHETERDLSSQALHRYRDEEGGLWARGADSDPAAQKVRLLEEYIRLDRDGDGVTELLCIHRVENTVLRVEEVDQQPFVVFCPFPMPHRMVGNGLADKTMDIQRLRSALWRQSLDSLYQANAPGMLVHEDAIGDNTIDDLLTVRPGRIVRWKGPAAPTPLVTPFAASASLQMMEIAVGERESRTGITRLNQGLDADALNKTASGTAMMQAQGQQIEDYIARNFGEALARLFAKKLRLMSGRGEPFTVNIDGAQQMVDPRTWPEEMDMSVQVGLGTGRKDARLAYRREIVAMQAQAMGNGLPMVGPKQLYNSAAGLIADMNIGSVNEYFVDPDTLPPPDPSAAPPDPELEKARAEQAMKQQEAQAKLQLSQAEAQAKMQIEREKAQMQAELAREKAELEAQLARERMQFEAELALERMRFEQEMAAQREAMAKVSEVTMPSYRPGGDLDK